MNKPAETPSPLVLVGTIIAAHGIRGQVKLESYTENPRAIAEYGTLLDAKGTPLFKVSIKGQTGPHLIAEIEGITTRNHAETLIRTPLYISRALLPETEESEFYQHDLIGLKVRRADGTQFGTVLAVHNFGASDIVEITLTESKDTEMFAFTSATFPEVNIKEGYIVIDPPEVIKAE